MKIKLCSILLAACVAAPIASFAQEQAVPECPPKKECASFAPKKGQWEFALMLGKGSSFYNDNAGSFLLVNPLTTQGVGSVGLPNGSTSQSGELDSYLNIEGFNNNSLVNIIGLQTKYFFKDCWSLNFSFGMNISITPKKDYVEGTSVYDIAADNANGLVGEDYTAIPAQKYINAQAKDNWFLTVGIDRYFATKNPRINPYVGVVAGFQMTRISTSEPYTGVTVNVDQMLGIDGIVDETDLHELPLSIFKAGGNVGQMMGITGAAVAGVEYGLSQGLYLALECRPIAYRYDIIQLAPQGYESYNLCHHNIKFIDMPIVKLGVRF